MDAYLVRKEDLDDTITFFWYIIPQSLVEEAKKEHDTERVADLIDYAITNDLDPLLVSQNSLMEALDYAAKLDYNIVQRVNLEFS